MQPSRTRLICRAHNRFTPSIALWQHYIAPNQPLLSQLRFSSSATEASYNNADKDGSLFKAHEASELETREGDVATEGKETPTPKIRKMTTVKGRWQSSKVNASIIKNVQKQYDSRKVSLTEPEKLLAIARAAFEATEDYEGIVVKPMVNPKPVKESQLPWCLKQEERTMSGIDRLAIEMDRFYGFAKPTRFESIARKHLIEQVRNHVRKALPDHVLEVFGSERTGLAFATSDIDFRLVRQSQIVDPAQAKLPPSPSERSKAIKDLNLLYWRRLKNNKAYLMPMLRYARYPLISLQDKESGLDVQIVLSNDTSLSRIFMQGYMEQYPYLRQLYYVIRTMFDVRGLSDVFRGGFGSYSLFMMVVASIRHNPHPRNDAAGGLINFLKFWRDFDTKERGVSIEPVEFFDKASHPVITDTIKSKIEEGTTKLLPAYMLSLRDPADETNDLGRKGIAIKHVQATFRSLCQQLEYDTRVNTRSSILGPLVGSCYMLGHAPRAKLEEYGQRLVKHMETSLAAKAKAVRDAEDHDKDMEMGIEGTEAVEERQVGQDSKVEL
ncbi:hypothetical protein BKA66DRAFT_575997 [Pyrenochaeta sp. MPI-SDFR-AT-0127]|nr:hypothetical protein BKA66DRAFT_575997 [Pyrenochaeta sp. MPI-SDFR-AT-0127]